MSEPKRANDFRVMPWWLVLVGVLLSILLGWLVLDWLLGEADRAVQADTKAQLRIDAIRTGLTVVAGTGGGLALLLAARRQWLSERTQKHHESVATVDHDYRERVHAHTEAVAEATQQHQAELARHAEHDATERRVTELFTKAVELLGSDQAAVRLGGLYALERLAQDNPKQRPTVFAVVCGYLRMARPGDDPQETEVRQSAQRLLTRHLKAGDPDTYWEGVRLDLTGASLFNFDASDCTLIDATFAGARFRGETGFATARMSGSVSLQAEFTGPVVFDEMTGEGQIDLSGALFESGFSIANADVGSDIWARRARSLGEVSASGSHFRGSMIFDNATLSRGANLAGATFHRGLSIERASIAGDATMQSAIFEGDLYARFARFHDDVSFEDARFERRLTIAQAEFHGRVTFEGAELGHRPTVDGARAAASHAHIWPKGITTTPVDADWVKLIES